MRKEIFIQEKRPHESGAKHVSGYAHYTDDISEPEGTLYGAIGWAKKSHAIIKKIDLKKVIKSEGVIAVVTNKDIPGRNDVGPVYDGDPIFPSKKVEYFGQPLFAVAAKSTELARKAVLKARISYKTLKPIIEAAVPKETYTVQLESMDSDASPFIITVPEFMRRMKEMQASGGGGMMGMGNFPDMYNLVVNTNHPLVGEILNTKTAKKQERLIKQSFDLAKLSQNLLHGEELTNFIKRSYELVK